MAEWQFNVISGVSGSGKSTLAFDILFNEGQRRYLESPTPMPAASCSPRAGPEVDAVYGIPPTVAIEQRLSRGGRKSPPWAPPPRCGTTCALLYVKFGTQHCVHDVAVRPSRPRALPSILTQFRRPAHRPVCSPLVVSRNGVYAPSWLIGHARGYTHLRVDGAFVPTATSRAWTGSSEHTIEAAVASPMVRPRTRLLPRELRWRWRCTTARAWCICWPSGIGGTLAAPPEMGPLPGPAQAVAWAGICRVEFHLRPAWCAAPAMPSWTRACSATTASTAGAPTAWARA